MHRSPLTLIMLCDYARCCSVRQEFPLAIVSFNVTTWVLGALRAGRLDTTARKLGGHLAAANDFYVGAMYEFYHRWVVRAGWESCVKATLTRSSFSGAE